MQQMNYLIIFSKTRVFRLAKAVNKTFTAKYLKHNILGEGKVSQKLRLSQCFPFTPHCKTAPASLSWGWGKGSVSDRLGLGLMSTACQQLRRGFGRIGRSPRQSHSCVCGICWWKADGEKSFYPLQACRAGVGAAHCRIPLLPPELLMWSLRVVSRMGPRWSAAARRVRVLRGRESCPGGEGSPL